LQPDEAQASSNASSWKAWWLRLVAVFVAALLVWRLADLLVDLTIGPGYTRAGHAARGVAVSAGALLVWLLALRYPPRRAVDYGVRLDRAGWAEAGAGATAYLVPWALATLVMVATTPTAFSAPVGSVAVLGQAALLVLLVLLLEAVPEELVFRGLLYGMLAERLPSWAAVVGQTALFCLFGALIGAATSLDRLVLFALFGLAMGASRAVTGSVLTTIGFHAAFQTVAQLLVGTSWDAVTVTDPDRWYADLAVGLIPLALGPVVLTAWARRRASGGQR
jgi:membrane protease YdiL (CAAX protease family)